MIEKIEVGDYLRYSGQFGHGLCILESFVENFGTRLSIQMMESGQNIVCDYEDVRLLTTHEDHIMAVAGFTKPDAEKQRYVHPNLTISSAGIRSQDMITLVPLSAVDFTKVSNLLSYVDDQGIFDYNRLDEDYRSVYFLKDFLEVLDEHEIAHNKEDLIKL